MKLLELIPTRYTSPEVIEQISEFLRGRLGKGVVAAKDTTSTAIIVIAKLADTPMPLRNSAPSRLCGKNNLRAMMPPSRRRPPLRTASRGRRPTEMDRPE